MNPIIIIRIIEISLRGSVNTIATTKFGNFPNLLFFTFFSRPKINLEFLNLFWNKFCQNINYRSAWKALRTSISVVADLRLTITQIFFVKIIEYTYVSKIEDPINQ